MKIKPIFISGIGRSGTSAVLSSMAGHSSIVDIERVGEAPFVSAFLNFLVDFEDKSPSAEYNLKNYRLDAEKRRELIGEFLMLNQCGEISESEGGENKYWITKTSLLEASFDKAVELFGEVRCLYIMRNGIEVINSARKHAGFEALSFGQQCSRWVENIEYCKYLHKRPLCAIIKHHELVKDPLTVYTEVFQKLKLPFDQSPIDWIGGRLFNSSFDEKSVGTSTSKLFENRLLGAWDSWTGEMKSEFIDQCDEMMVEFGFERPYANSSVAPCVKGNSPLKSCSEPVVRPLVERPKARVFSNFLKQACSDRISLAEFDYTCNIGVRQPFLFVNNPKVASTSLLGRLQTLDNAEQAAKMLNPHQRLLSPLRRISQLGLSEQDIALTDDDMFRFAFCRDPYERLLSAYLSKIAKPLGGFKFNPSKSKISPPKGQIIARLTGKDIDENTDYEMEIAFHEFVEVVCQIDVIDMDLHWKPQFDVLLPDVLKYQFIGRFETLERDMSNVTERLSSPEVVPMGRSKNMTNSNAQITKYYSPDLRGMVCKKYSADFEFFNYRKESKLVASSLISNG